jgi:hypothetical protein
MTELAVEFFTAKLDRTAPKITVTTPEDGAEYKLDQPLTAQYSCADEDGGSGLKEGTCTAKLADGTPAANNAPLDTSTVGEKTLTVRAEDNAGNVAEKVVHYRVVYDFSGLSGQLGERDADGNYVLTNSRLGQPSRSSSASAATEGRRSWPRATRSRRRSPVIRGPRSTRESRRSTLAVAACATTPTPASTSTTGRPVATGPPAASSS